MSNGCDCFFVNAFYAFLLYDCEMSECALICIISFLSFFPSQFSAPFCPEKLNYFLFGSTVPALLEKRCLFQLCPLAASPRPDSLSGHPVMAPEPAWEQREHCY